VKILKGKPVADAIRGNLAGKLSGKRLGIFRFGKDPSSESYLRGINKNASLLGVKVEIYTSYSTQKIYTQLEEFNRYMDGVLLLKPFPKGISIEKMIKIIGPEKDVEGIHPENLGQIMLGKPRVIPPTPGAVMEIIKFYNIQTDGEFVVIIGRSEVVGKPIANLFLLKTQTGNATVTVCHSKTKNLKGISKKADILVVSIGKPNFIDSGFVKRGSFVIDVGINLTPEGIKGDVNFEDVSSYVKGITPVPGGVGSITSALLMKNLSYL